MAVNITKIVTIFSLHVYFTHEFEIWPMIRDHVSRYFDDAIVLYFDTARLALGPSSDRSVPLRSPNAAFSPTLLSLCTRDH